MTTPVDIDKLKELLKLATQRPWEYDTSDPDPMFTPNWTIYEEADCEHSIAEVNGQICGSADAALIVAAVNSLPALIAKAERVDALEAALREIAKPGCGAGHDWSDDELASYWSSQTNRCRSLARNALSPKPENAAS